MREGFAIILFYYATLQCFHKSLDGRIILISPAYRDNIRIGLGCVPRSFLNRKSVRCFESCPERIIVIDYGNRTIFTVLQKGGNRVSLRRLNLVAMVVYNFQDCDAGIHGSVGRQFNQPLLFQQQQSSGLIRIVIRYYNSRPVRQLP